jgi:hypothetical protein
MLGWGSSTPISVAGTYVLASWLFLRLLGLIYFAAFVSLATQIRGLVGVKGILPAAEFLASRRSRKTSRFWRVPTLCWISSADGFLLFLCWGGAALSLLLVVGVAPVIALFLLWLFYLSLLTVCRLFLGYQWDILLLETGFLAIFLAPPELVPRFPPSSAPSPLIVWLFWWLLFRLMFSSGLVKLRSGDRTWRTLTALCHHYQTQPLPTPVAWYAHQLPVGFHKLSAALLLAIEFCVPFFIFGPPGFRFAAALSFIALMALIQFTGNYCFFNLLGIALSFLLLDDRLLGPVFEALGISFPAQVFAPPTPVWVLVSVAALILTLSAVPVLRLFRLEIDWPGRLADLFEFLDRFRLVNSYGLFSVMTTERPEIIIEGSHDGSTWRRYQFKWKPGDPNTAPRFCAPHQPRLDWQMWFTALGYYGNNPWFHRFLKGLLEGSPPVLSLLRDNPFPEKPPQYLRSLLYDFRFSDRASRRATGAWWVCEPRGIYAPPLEAGQNLENGLWP